jgi:branched-chain amino acid transport system permease protein
MVSALNWLSRPGLWLTLAVVGLIGLSAPLSGSASLRETMFTMLMFVAFASSLNLMLGYTGYVSFGHIVFFGWGGYVGFYLMAAHHWPLAAAVLSGGLAAALLALLLGLAILRLRGAYFALATIGINEAMRAFISNFGLFGGPTGLSLNFAVYKTYGGPAQALWITFYAVWALTVLAVVVSYGLKTSKFGLGLVSIREDEDAAMVMGVRAPLAKTIAYVISAIIPGMIGVLFFFKNGNVEPGDAFRLHMSIEMIVMVMLGGQGTVLGPVLGAASYQQLRTFLLTSDLQLTLGRLSLSVKELQLTFAGLSLLIIVLFIPAGVVGFLRARFPRLRRVLE